MPFRACALSLAQNTVTGRAASPCWELQRRSLGRGSFVYTQALSVSLCSPRGGGFYHRSCGVSPKGLAFGSGPPGFSGSRRPQPLWSPTAGGRQGEAGCSGEPTSQDGNGDRQGLCRALGPQCGPAGARPQEGQSQGQGPAQGMGLSGVRELTSFAPTLFCTSSCLPSGLQTPPLWPQGTTGTLRHAQTLCLPAPWPGQEGYSPGCSCLSIHPSSLLSLLGCTVPSGGPLLFSMARSPFPPPAPLPMG